MRMPMKNLKLSLLSFVIVGISLLGASDSDAMSTGAEVRALLEESASLVEQAGLPGEARGMREQLSIFSDDELLDAYGEADLQALVDAQASALETSASADAAEMRSVSPRAMESSIGSRRTLQDSEYPSVDWNIELGSGPGTTHPARDPGVRSDGAASISKWNTIREQQIAVQTAWDALTVARDAYDVCIAAGDQTAVGGGIGVCAGGNTSAVCTVVAGAVLAVQITFTVLESEWAYNLAEQQSTDFLDGAIDSAEIGKIAEGTEYLNNQLIQLDVNLGAHDTRIREQLADHDDDIKQQLQIHDEEVEERLSTHDQEIKTWLLRIQAKANLALKTQLENMLTSNGGARAGVAYLERLDEVCSLAYEAISDATAAGYKVSQTALNSWVEGDALREIDPKRAHDSCRAAYQMASSRSRRLVD